MDCRHLLAAMDRSVHSTLIMAMSNPVDVPRQAWLFVRRDESIRLTKLTLGATLLVFGPGATEHSHHFDADTTLEEFRSWYQARLCQDGWALEQVPDRRKERRAPPGNDRRRLREV